MPKQEVTLEQVRELMTLLTGGDLPDAIMLPDPPALPPAAAFSVIWYLQEHLRVLPNNIEMCVVCGELFDADCAGHIVADDDTDDAWYADNGIDPALVAAYAGVDLCSESCAHAFWRDPTAYHRPSPLITFTELPR